MTTKGGSCMESKPTEAFNTIERSHIYLLSDYCDRLFKQILEEQHIKFESEDHKRLLSELQVRFTAWLSYLGVFASAKASLDHRLRRNAAYRDLVLLALDMLRMNLINLLPAHDASDKSLDSDVSHDPDFLYVAISGIEDATSQLDRLAITIRQSSSSTLTARVKAFTNKCFKDLHHFETKALLALEIIYPDAPGRLRMHLAKSMVDRFARLLYWKSHNGKLQTDRCPADTGKLATSSSLKMMVKGQPRSEFAAKANSAQNTNLDQPIIKRPGSLERTEIGTVASTMVNKSLIEVNGPHSPKQERSASSVAVSKHVYPSPPNIERGLIHAACTFCYKKYSVYEYSQNRWWKNHVKGDLQPYVCLVPNCHDPKAFSVNHEWESHMAGEHGEDWLQLICKTSSHHSDTLKSTRQLPPVISNKDEPEYHLGESHEDREHNLSYVRDTESFYAKVKVFCDICAREIEKEDNIAPRGKIWHDPKAAVSKEGHNSAATESGLEESLAKTVTSGVDGAMKEAAVSEDNNSSTSTFGRKISRHILSHLEYLSLLTLQLSSSMWAEGQYRDFHSSFGNSELEGRAERSTVLDTITDAGPDVTSYQEETPNSIFTNADSVEQDNESERWDWDDICQAIKIDEDDPIEHMKTIHGLFDMIDLPHNQRLSNKHYAELRNGLMEAMVNKGSLPHNKYIPIHKQEELLNKNAIKLLFKHLLGLLDVDTEDKMESLVQYCMEQVCSSVPRYSGMSDEAEKASKKKLLATLILVDRPAAIISFIRQGITDLELPIQKPIRSADHIGSVIVKDQTDRNIQSFSHWSFDEAIAFWNYQYYIWDSTSIPRYHDSADNPGFDDTLYPERNSSTVENKQEKVQDTFQNTSTSITYEHIFNACVNNLDEGDANAEGCSLFLPKNMVESLMQPESVKSTLRDHFGEITDRDIEDLAEYVMTHATQVFLTLVYSNNVDALNKLQRSGFKDEDLPVCIKSSKIYTINSNSPLECFADWKSFDIDNFCEKQWIFLAPVFHEKRFMYKFNGKHRLPYLPARQPGDGSGHFSEVRKLQLHFAHYQMGEYDDKNADIPSGGSIDVAVKRLFQNGQDTDVEGFYEKERHTLETMRNLNHKHLIRAIAAYTKGNDKYFLFPWANGGNLQDVLQSNRGTLDKDLVAWVLDQIVGLSEAIKALHDKNIRHGDIKPSNILCSGPGTGNCNESTLIIADVGLAKQQVEYTRYRNNTTTTRHGSITYEPPEVSPKRQLKTLSRKYDIWSLGCVFLELIIWAVYDVHGTKSFHSHLSQDSIAKFWEETGSVGAEQIHSAVGIWIKRLRSDLKGSSAFSDIIELIETKLLIISDKRRADSKAVVESLKIIRRKVSEPGYLFNPELEKLAAGSRLPASNGSNTQNATNRSTQYVSSHEKKPPSWTSRLRLRARRTVGDILDRIN